MKGVSMNLKLYGFSDQCVEEIRSILFRDYTTKSDGVVHGTTNIPESSFHDSDNTKRGYIEIGHGKHERKMAIELANTLSQKGYEIEVPPPYIFFSKY